MSKNKTYGRNVIIGQKTKSKKYELLLSPDEKGVSRWSKVELWSGDLKFGNGNAAMRKGSAMDRKYILEYKRGKGRKILEVRANGFNEGGKNAL